MPEILLDSNLLVLTVVGNVDRHLIGRHRRTKPFSEYHFEHLLDIISRASRVCVTPNTLTETSNLLDYGERNMRYEYRSALKGLVEDDVIELVVPSVEAVGRLEFLRLGIADCALLALLSSDRWLITTDLELYLAGVALFPNSVVNFTEYVDKAGRA